MGIDQLVHAQAQGLESIEAKEAIELKEEGVIAHHGHVKAPMINAEPAGDGAHQADRSDGRRRKLKAPPGSHVVQKAALPGDAPVAGDNALAEHNDAQVTVDGQG